MTARTTDYAGRIEEFSGNVASWTSWYGRLQFYFEANDIMDAGKKRAHLLTLCGAQTNETVCALLQPVTPDQVDYADIVAALQAHFNQQSTLSEVYSRAMFQRQDQLHGQSVRDYAAALRKLSAS